MVKTALLTENHRSNYLPSEIKFSRTLGLFQRKLKAMLTEKIRKFTLNIYSSIVLHCDRLYYFYKIH